ncbi:hypothetical protein NMG60_11026227 [Bertholletia excelsa]
MDTLYVKSESEKGNRLRSVAKWFRLVEICSVLGLFFWTLAKLPFAVKISGAYVRLLIAVLVSPLCIFVLGNAIVILLLVKSGQFSSKTHAVDGSASHLYEEFIKSTVNDVSCRPKDCSPAEIVHQQERIVTKAETVITNRSQVEIVGETILQEKTVLPRSDNYRSETKRCRQVKNIGEVPAETVDFVDELSNEEFQRAVEEFIAKQVKLLQEEKLAIVTCY